MPFPVAMCRRLVAALLFVPAAVCAHADPSSGAASVPSYQLGSRLAKDQTRIRISLTLNEDQPIDGVSVGGVTACSRTACFKLPTVHTVKLTNTAAGKSTALADAVLPAGELTDIYFERGPGAVSVTGSIHLARPFAVEQDIPGGEILISVDRSNGTTDQLQPVASATNVFNDASDSVYYNPRYATEVGLQAHARLSIPANATDTLQIWTVAVTDAAGSYPFVDMYPEVQLYKEARVTVRASRLQPLEPRTIRFTKTGVLEAPTSLGLHPPRPAVAEEGAAVAVRVQF